MVCLFVGWVNALETLASLDAIHSIYIKDLSGMLNDTLLHLLKEDVLDLFCITNCELVALLKQTTIKQR